MKATELAAAVEECREELMLLASQDRILGRHHLHPIAAILIGADVDFLFVFSDKGGLIPSLSIATTQKTIVEFQNVRDLERYINSAQEMSKFKSTKHCRIRLKTKIRNADQLLDKISDLCELVFQNSLVARNRGRDDRRRVLVALRTMISQRQIGGVLDLAIFLMNQLPVKVELMVLNNTGPSEYPPGRIASHEFRLLLERPGFSILARNAFEGTKIFELVTGEDRSSKAGKSHFLVPIRSRSVATLFMPIIMLITTHQRSFPMTFSALDMIAECVELFLVARYREGQISALSFLARTANHTQAAARFVGYADYKRQLIDLIEQVADRVLNSTASHSFAYLEYRPEKYSLASIYVKEAPLGGNKGPPSTDLEKGCVLVSLRQYRERISAFAFRHARSFTSVYVPNVHRVPPNLRELGLQSVTVKKTRGTRCEISIPLKRNGLPFAVINIESAVPNGLDSDTEFLESIADLVTTASTAILRSSDQAWMLESVEFQETLHEFKNYLHKVEGQDRVTSRIRKTIEEILSDTARIKPKTKSLLDIFEDTRLWMLEGYEQLPEKREQIHRFFTYSLADRILLDEVKARGIRIILKNLCSNWLKYGDRQQDRLIVTVEPEGKRSSQDVLSIAGIYYSWFVEGVLDQAFIAPVEFEGRVCHGLLIVGAVVRALGGQLWFDRANPQGGREPGLYARRALNIELPL